MDENSTQFRRQVKINGRNIKYKNSSLKNKTICSMGSFPEGEKDDCKKSSGKTPESISDINSRGGGSGYPPVDCDRHGGNYRHV